MTYCDFQQPADSAQPAAVVGTWPEQACSIHIENPDYAPYGSSLGESFQQQHELPQAESTLDIELTLPPEPDM